MMTRAKISAVRALGVWRLFEEALVNFFVPDAALIQGECLIVGAALNRENTVKQKGFTFLRNEVGHVRGHTESW